MTIPEKENGKFYQTKKNFVQWNTYKSAQIMGPTTLNMVRHVESAKK